MKTSIRLFVFVVFLFALSLVPARGQNNPNEEQGMKPYDSWHGGDLDSVSMTNGGLTLHIPLLSFPQRGSLDFSFFATFSNKQWAKHTSPRGNIVTWNPMPLTGTRIVSSLDWWMNSTYSSTTDSTGFTEVDWSRSVTSPDGNSHKFGKYLGGAVYPIRSLDATGLLNLDTHTLVTANGARYTYPGALDDFATTGGLATTDPGYLGIQPIAVTDANGNQITTNASGWIDTMGRLIPGSSPVAGQPIQPGVPTTDLTGCGASATSALVWNVPGLASMYSPGGSSTGTRTYKFCYSPITLAPTFGNATPLYGPAPMPLLTAIIQPDGTQWTFGYDEYGDVTRLGFPTGGSISYTYKIGPSNTIGGQGTDKSMWVASRTVDANDSTGGHTWTYNYSVIPNPNPLFTNSYCQGGLAVVTSPTGDDTVHTIMSPVANTHSAYDIQVQHYQGPASANVLLKTENTQYSGMSGVNAGVGTVGTNVVPIQTSVTLANGLTTKVVSTYDTPVANPGNNQPGPLAMIGSVLQKDEYDFTNTLSRSTLYHYLWQDNATYKNANFVGLVSSTTVVDGAGNQLSKTVNGYDETAVSFAGIVTSSLVLPPAGGNLRGNLTSSGSWLDTTNSYVTGTATYFDTGMKASSTAPKASSSDPLNRTTTYTYDQIKFMGAYLTQTIMPDTIMPDPGATAVHHAVSGDYDFSTGLLTKFTDENGNSFTYLYDPQKLWLAQANHPDGGQTKFFFPNATTVERQRKIDATRWDDSFAYFDGLGRPIQSQQITPSGAATVDTTYDAMGRVSTVSNPYYLGTNHASDSTFGFTQTQYDALGRSIKTIKQDQSFSTVSYDQSAAFMTSVNCTTSTDEAGKIRKTCVDGLGRLVEVDEPAGDSPGSTSTGTITINGTLQATSVGGHGATQAVGSVTINPATTADRSIQVQNNPGASGSVTVTISGVDTFTVGDCAVVGKRLVCPPKVYDTGSVTISVNVGGTIVSSSWTYGGSDTPSTIADNLANGFRSSFTVGHTAGTNTFTLTANSTGIVTNYPISASCSSGQGNCGWKESFTQVATGAATTSFTGGANPTYTTVYDTGTVVITVNGHSDQVAYGQNDNAGTIAANLATAINADTAAFVSARASGSTISLTSKNSGSATNVGLTSSISYDTSHFNIPLLATSNSGALLTGGTDATPGTTVTDSGTVTLTAGSFSAQACYGKSGVCQSVPPGCVTGDSTASQVACILAQGLNGTGSPVKASANGAVITIVYNTVGAAGNGAVTISSTSNQPANFAAGSFSGSGVLSGGADPVVASMDHPNVTLYQYSVRGELLCVHQKATDTSADKACGDPTVPATWRPRNFTYDSFSRLLTSSNPESGSITYNYDNFHLVARTDARGNVASYTYDAQNRPLDISYSDPATPKASFRYDYASFNGQSLGNPIGKMVAAFVGSDNTSLTSYDTVGRATKTVACIPGVAVCQSFAASYDLMGDPLTLNYPGNGFSLTYAYDNAARLISATDSNQFVYAQNPLITAFGAMQQYSTPNFNYKTSFNSRLQPTEIAAVTTGTTPQALFDKTYQYNPAGATTPMNNGNIYSVTNLKDDTRTQTYTYDALNRLLSAGDKTHWSNTYAYDAWGNLYQKNPGAPGAPAQGEKMLKVADSNNRLSGLAYDGNGNVTYDGTHHYAYDAENRITCLDPDPTTGQCAASSTSFTYDALGRRIAKTTGNNRTNYWYAGGQIMAETDSVGNWTYYIFFAGQRLARNTPQPAPQAADIKYYITDHLHSTAVFADKSGTIVDDNDYYPWGGLVTGVGTTASNNHYKFTGKERDTESGLDYFGARYYSSTLGRFISSDWSAIPAPVPYAEMSDPQSLNLYSYVRNRPTTLVDTNGHKDDKTHKEMTSKNYVIKHKDGSKTTGRVDVTTTYTKVGDGNGNFHDQAISQTATISEVNVDADGHPVDQGTKDTYTRSIDKDGNSGSWSHDSHGTFDPNSGDGKTLRAHLDILDQPASGGLKVAATTAGAVAGLIVGGPPGGAVGAIGGALVGSSSLGDMLDARGYTNNDILNWTVPPFQAAALGKAIGNGLVDLTKAVYKGFQQPFTCDDPDCPQ